VSAAPANYVWWLAGRSAGIVAMLLTTASVVLGLAMAARLVPPRRRREATRLHQHLAMIGLAAIAAHGLLLAADPWLKAGLGGVLVPFSIGYRPLWTSMGIVGGYLAAILGLSFYVRRRIGARLWRRMHRATVLVYVLSLGHALGAGTDAALAPVRWTLLASAVPIIALFSLRLARAPGGRASRQAGGATVVPAPGRRSPAAHRGGSGQSQLEASASGVG
jgi:sulfoxide reductase heme-binding subunit YedZ